MADWTEQAEEMLETWMEVQKNVWDSWQDLAGRASVLEAKSRGVGASPMDWFQESMSSWTDPSGVAGDAGRQVFGSQYSMMRNLEMLTKAWQLVAPSLDAGKDWRAELSEFTNNWFRQLMGVSDLLDMSKNSEALWRSYTSEWGPLLRPWMSSAIEASGSGHLGEMMLGSSAGLSRLFSMGQDEFQQLPFTGLADIPSVGLTREHQAKILRAFDAFVDMRKAMLEFNKITAGALGNSVEAVIDTLVKRSKKGEKVKSVRELNRLWLDSADDVFTQMYASEEYLKVQRKLSSAGMNYKIMQQEVIEMALRNLNMPTRSELDDAYKMLYELRKEVKSLRKALREKSALSIETGKATPNAIKQVARKNETRVAVGAQKAG